MIRKHINKNLKSPPDSADKKPFISKRDLIWIVMLALTGTFINNIPYTNALSIQLQISLAVVIFIFNFKRPVMIFVVYIFLNILPTRLIGGFSKDINLYYTLNKLICIVFAITLLITNIIFLRKKIKGKFNPWLVAFGAFALISFAWTISYEYYNFDFLWLCTVYILFPFFIENECDLKVILISYVIYVNIFCISILPILSNKTLYRGIISLDPNFASFSILIGLISALVLLVRYNKQIKMQIKIFLIAGMILNIIIMGFFASRTAYICLAVIFIVYLIINIQKVRTIILMVIATCTTYFVLNYNGYFDSVLARFSDVSSGSVGGRLDIWGSLLTSLARMDFFNFFFGNGFLTTALFGTGMQAHNTYLSIMTSFGVVGLFLFIIYQFNSFRSMIKRKFLIYTLLGICLLIYNFSLEPYLINEGIVFFSLLGAFSKIENEMETKKLV